MSTNHSKDVSDKRAGKAPANYLVEDSEQSTTTPLSNDTTANGTRQPLEEESSFRQRLQHSMQSLWHSTTGQAAGQQGDGQWSTSLSTYSELGESRWRDKQETTSTSASTSHGNNTPSITRIDRAWREQTGLTPSTSTNADWKQWTNDHNEHSRVDTTNAWHVPVHSTLQLAHHELTNHLPDSVHGNLLGYLPNNNNNDDGAEVVAFLQQPYYTEQIEENQGEASSIFGNEHDHVDLQVAGLPIAWIQSFRERWQQQQQSSSSSSTQCYLSPAERYLAQLLESTSISATLAQTGYKPSMDIVAYLEQHTYTDDIYNEDLLPPAVRQGEQALRQLLRSLDAKERAQNEANQHNTMDSQQKERDELQRRQAIERLRLLQRHLMA
ncbi:hypothetical protein BDF22DRAFT_745540 [Syncephalis plumigaleata]|nr:hypothetical protein BDF22DRAFT_745540 [Syncephalis plumigaleata]